MQLLINYGTMVAFVILSLGIFFQIRKIFIIRNAESIAVWEVILRLLASIILLIKIFGTKDTYLIGGQGVFTIIYSCYFVIVVKYKSKNVCSLRIERGDRNAEH